MVAQTRAKDMSQTKARARPSASMTTAASPRRWRKTAAVTAERREHMIAEAAYYIAEHRNFQGGDPGQDWLQAEAEIDRGLNAAAPR
jgi:hypothetical protein